VTVCNYCNGTGVNPFYQAGFDAAMAQQPKQEPVAWTLLLVGEHNGIVGKAGDTFENHAEHYKRVDVYTTPQQRTWIGLTDEEIEDCYKQGGIGRAIQMLKEKNT